MFVKSGAKVRILFWLTNSRMLFLHFVPRFIGNDGKSAYLCDGIPALIIHPPIMKTAKGIWKNIGLILLCLGALNLAACFFTRHISNAVLGVSLAVIFGGLLIYIIQNKRTNRWLFSSQTLPLMKNIARIWFTAGHPMSTKKYQNSESDARDSRRRNGDK